MANKKSSNPIEMANDLQTDLTSLIRQGLGTSSLRTKYWDEPWEYMYEQLGFRLCYKFHLVLVNTVNMAKEGRPVRIIIKGARGAGKSRSVSILEFILWHWLGYDCVNMGGSEEQAKIVFNYIDSYIEWEKEFKDAVDPSQGGKRQISEITKAGPKPQPWIHCVTASTKAVRGPHPGAERVTGGVLVCDEAAEADSDIIYSAMPMVNTATPSITILLSTFHNDVGAFQEIWDGAVNISDFLEDLGLETNVDAEDFVHVSIDAFDIIKSCNNDCNDCYPDFRDMYCNYKCECADDFGFHMEYKPGEIPDEIIDNNMICLKCGIKLERKARTANGHLPLSMIEFYYRQFVVAQKDRARFEVEIMGWRPSAATRVLDPQTVDKCTLAINDTIPATIRAAERRLGIDWGYATMTSLVLVQDRPNSLITDVLDNSELQRMSDQIIYDKIGELKKTHGMFRIYADSSHPFQNVHLREAGYDVIEVNFGQSKEFGVGVLRYLFENGLMRIHPNFTALRSQLKAWRRDKNGHIVKKNDHHADAMLCACIKRGDEMDVVTTQRIEPDIGSEVTNMEDNFYERNYGDY